MDLACQSFIISYRHLILQSVFQVKLPNACRTMTILDFNSVQYFSNVDYDVIKLCF